MKRYRVELALILTGIVALTTYYFAQRSALEEKGLSHLVSAIGVPLDDVYIHCRYAENLLAGNGYTFNPGSGIVTADTSPLWVVLVAFGGLFTSHLEVIAVLFSALFFLLLAVAVYRFALQLGINQNWSVVAGILTLLSGRIIWSGMSGMEITLASLLVILTLQAHVRRQYSKAGLLLALGVATRPELLFLALILFSDHLLRILKDKEGRPTFLKSVSLFIIVVSPVFLLPLIERGSLLYHSSVVQGAKVNATIDFGYLWFAAKILFSTVTPPFVVGLFSIVIFRSDRRYRIIQLFAFGLPILLAIVAPQFRHHGRYFFPAIPLIIILGVAVLASFMQRKRLPWTAVVLFLLMFHAVLVAARWRNIYAYSVTNIVGQHVATANWIQEHTTTNDIIASHDVGALGYLTNRSVIDLVGLVTPQLFPLQADQRLVWQAARNSGANIFIIYDRLNPSFYDHAKDSLVRITSFRAEPLVASADTVMNIYRIRQYADH